MSNENPQPDLDGKRMRPAIYAVEHVPSSKERLVCGTTCLSKRLSDQLHDLRAKKHYNASLQADLERDGPEAFKFIFLDFVHRDCQVGLMKRWHIADARRRGIPIYNAPAPVSRRLLTMDRPQQSSSASAEAGEATKRAIERLKNLNLRCDDRLDFLIKNLINDSQAEAKTPNQEHSERK